MFRQCVSSFFVAFFSFFLLYVNSCSRIAVVLFLDKELQIMFRQCVAVPPPSGRLIMQLLSLEEIVIIIIVIIIILVILIIIVIIIIIIVIIITNIPVVIITIIVIITILYDFCLKHLPHNKSS